MKFQNYIPFGPWINEWGCDIDAFAERAEFWLQKVFSDDEFLMAYHQAIALGFVQPELKNSDGSPKDGCSIWDYVGLVNLFGLHAISERTESASYIPKDNELELLELRRNGYPGSHFVSGNGQANSSPWQDEIAFDPWEGGSHCAREGWICSKRILVIE